MVLLYLCLLVIAEYCEHIMQGSTIRVALWPGASRMLCRASASGTDLSDRASGHHETPVWAIVTLTKYSFHTNLNKNSLSIREKFSAILYFLLWKNIVFGQVNPTLGPVHFWSTCPTGPVKKNLSVEPILKTVDSQMNDWQSAQDSWSQDLQVVDLSTFTRYFSFWKLRILQVKVELTNLDWIT